MNQKLQNYKVPPCVELYKKRKKEKETKTKKKKNHINPDINFPDNCHAKQPFRTEAVHCPKAGTYLKMITVNEDVMKMYRTIPSLWSWETLPTARLRDLNV